MSRIYLATFLACIVQGVYSQAILPNGVMNNGMGYNGFNIATNNLPNGYPNNIANGYPNNIANNAIPNNLPNNMANAYPMNTIGGYPFNGNIAGNTNAAIANAASNIVASNIAIEANGGTLPVATSGIPLTGVSPIGFGDVAVAGEMPVGGSTAVTGNVPVIGYVTFEGYLPAGGMVTVASNCACNGETPVQNV